MMYFYLELKNKNTGEIVDCYGYENYVSLWTKGSVRLFKTGNLHNTKKLIDYITNGLLEQGYIIINTDLI